MQNCGQVDLFPTFYISHGGGPCFFMDAAGRLPFSHMDKHSKVAQWYRDFQKNHVPTKPKTIIIISAHWEERNIHITSNPNPELYFDYYGFPPDTYKLKYPAPCNVELAKKLNQRLNEAGFSSQLDDKRNWDHGVFIPLLLMFPDADVPLVQISLKSNLSAKEHIEIGKIIGHPDIRKDAIIIGSGFATHNLSATRGGPSQTVPWITWLTKTVTDSELTKSDKENLLINWSSAPSAKFAHPREEHLLPLHVAFGASSTNKAEIILDFTIEESALSFASYKFV